jgi:hypothetical protein
MMAPGTPGDIRFFERASIGSTKATAVWNRFTTPDQGFLNNVDFGLYSAATNALLGASVSAIDNVEQVRSTVSDPAVLVLKSLGVFQGSAETVALAHSGGFVERGGPNVGLTLSFPSIAHAGSQFAIQATATNTGDLRGHGYAASLNLPPGYVLASGANPQALGSLGPGAVAVATWVVTAPSSPQGPMVFTAGATTISYGRQWLDGAEGTIATVTPPVPTASSVRLDFEGNGTTDVAVFRPTTGQWFVLPSSKGFTGGYGVTFGGTGDQPLFGDFDGDGRRDPAVYRSSTGTWFWLKSSSGDTQYEYRGWGVAASGDLPAPGDFDGDGKTDPAVFRPSHGTWFVLKSSSAYTQYFRVGWGAAGDRPVQGDYDGDGRTDIAIYRPSTGQWFIVPSSTNFSVGLPAVTFGGPGDVPVTGDFDGDGKRDIAVYRSSAGTWFILRSSSANTSYDTFGWGVQSQGDTPVPGDYDGDGRTDLCVYRPAYGTWFVLKSSTANTRHATYGWGATGDVPLGGER